MYFPEYKRLEADEGKSEVDKDNSSNNLNTRVILMMQSKKTRFQYDLRFNPTEETEALPVQKSMDVPL
jgi:hypothetical protein